MKATINLNDQLRQTSLDAQIIRNNENLLNAIFQSVPVGLLIKNKDHVIERVNDTYLEWYDLERDTVIGARSEFLMHFREDERRNTDERPRGRSPAHRQKTKPTRAARKVW